MVRFGGHSFEYVNSKTSKCSIMKLQSKKKPQMF